jgi:hypothetical protein
MGPSFPLLGGRADGVERKAQTLLQIAHARVSQPSLNRQAGAGAPREDEPQRDPRRSRDAGRPGLRGRLPGRTTARVSPSVIASSLERTHREISEPRHFVPGYSGKDMSSAGDHVPNGLSTDLEIAKDSVVTS